MSPWLNLVALFFIVLVWIEGEIYINTGVLWVDYRALLVPFLFVDLVWMLGWLARFVKEMNEMEKQFSGLWVPEWVYEE